MDKDTFGKRVVRMGRIGGQATGLATKFLTEKYLGNQTNRGEHAAALQKALGNLRGPIVKVAQLLATIPEALPEEYANELQQLQSSAPSMGWPFVRRRMQAELGQDWQKRFDRFEKKAANAASLGQVHRATSLDGQEELACKIQYPDMASAVRSDLGQLNVLMKLFGAVDGSVNMQHAMEEIKERLWEELDYEREALATQMYGRIFANEPTINVPAVKSDLSTKRLLTSSWLNGYPILSFEKASPEVRSRIATILFHAWYIPFYHYGIIHGDPHYGNYTIRYEDDEGNVLPLPENPEEIKAEAIKGINLLDFGCIRVFPASFVEAVIMLYNALGQDDRQQAIRAFEQWGFHDLTDETIDALLVWAGFLYKPLLQEGIGVIGKRVKGQIHGRDVAQNVHKSLRKSGGVTVPREFVFVDRAALGLGSVFIRLQAEVNWSQLFQSLIKNFDVKEVEKRQADLLQQSGFPLSSTGDHS